MFLNIHEWPEGKAFALRALQDLKMMQMHASRAGGAFSAWPEPLHEGGWSVLPFKWQGEIVNDVWPWLRSDIVVNAGYSRMAPGTVIEPHEGYTSDVLRLHIGLDCPMGDCAIQVGVQERGWVNGGMLLFDDTIEHSAWNRTDRDRVILLVDLQKEKRAI